MSHIFLRGRLKKKRWTMYWWTKTLTVPGAKFSTRLHVPCTCSPVRYPWFVVVWLFIITHLWNTVWSTPIDLNVSRGKSCLYRRWWVAPPRWRPGPRTTTNQFPCSRYDCGLQTSSRIYVTQTRGPTRTLKRWWRILDNVDQTPGSPSVTTMKLHSVRGLQNFL